MSRRDGPGRPPADPSLAAPPGLCAGCRHARVQRGGRSAFWRCARADSDPRFLRYPPLPVRACPGFAPREEDADGARREDADGARPGGAGRGPAG